MALRAVPEHPKFARLKKELGLSKYQAIGLLEALWHFTGKFALRGNIGKFTDAEIEAWIEWSGLEGAAVKALTVSGWLDASHEHRLVVHDWNEHADSTTKKQLGRKEKQLQRERETGPTNTGFVSDMSTESSTQTRPPAPAPEPAPAPAPEPVARMPHKENISSLVSRIAVAFPKSRLASLTAADVRSEHTVAIIQAVDAEVERVGVTRIQAAQMILDRLEILGREVPMSEWKFFQKLPEFMRDRQYRLDPEVFKNGSAKQDHSPRVSPAVQRQSESDEALRNIARRRHGVSFADEAGQGQVSQSAAPRSDPGDVPDGVGGTGAQVRPAEVPGSVIDGNTGEQVFPRARGHTGGVRGAGVQPPT